MINFQYTRANDVPEAVGLIGRNPNAKFIAGGTNLIDLMKMDVEQPTAIIDITRLPLKQVEGMPGGGLRIGALVRNTDLAYHPLVEQRYPVLASAIMAVPRNSCAIWPRQAEISSSVRAAITSMTQRRPVTNESLAAAAPPLTATIACMRSSVRAKPASQSTHLTCASRLRYWRRRSTLLASRATA
jgi:hypothetical protein